MQYKGKKITVMGIGLYGNGVAVVNFLLSQGAIVTATDLRTKKQLSSVLPKIKKSNKLKLVLGKHRKSDFVGADVVVKNPGVPNTSPYLILARKRGITIENDASLFFKNCPAEIVAITGTRGKSTTVWMTFNLLKNSGKKVFIAGLPTWPLMELVGKLKKSDIVVLELSSWQLEVLGEHKLAPGISLITNIYPDHLNRYASMQQYSEAKENIFKFQTSTDVCILNNDNSYTKKFAKKVPSQRILFSEKKINDKNASYVKGKEIIFRYNGKERKICRIEDIALKGKHNLYNALGAITVAALYHVKPEKIRKTLKNLKGLPARMEVIKKIAGIAYINDTASTTPDATIAGLLTLEDRKTVLIAGGETKGLPQSKYDELAKIIVKKCSAVVLLSGRGSEQLLVSLKKSECKKIVAGCSTMASAVNLARSFAKPGSNVLLSPACASFNMFVNEYDRGDQFNELIKEL